MKLNISRPAATASVLLISLVLILSGCSKGYSPVQPQANKQTEDPFKNILPYSGLAMSEVSESIAPGPDQADKLRGPVLELSTALISDYESGEIELSYGVERYGSNLAKINATLTPAQQAAFGKLLAYHVDVIHFGKDLRHFLRRIARELNLTPEQVEKVKACARTYAEGVRGVYKDVKDGKLTRDEAKPKIRELYGDFINCIKSVLTPEQLEKLKRCLEHGRGH